MVFSHIGPTPESRGLAGLVLRKIKAHPDISRHSWDYDNKITYIGRARSSGDVEMLRAFLAHTNQYFSDVATTVEALRMTGCRDIAEFIGRPHFDALRTLRERDGEGWRLDTSPLGVDVFYLVAAQPDDLDLWMHLIFERGIRNARDLQSTYAEMKAYGVPALVCGAL